MLIFYLLERDSCLPLLMLCEKVIVPQLSLSAYRIVYCDGESARKAVHAIFVCLFVCFFFLRGEILLDTLSPSGWRQGSVGLKPTKTPRWSS